MYGTVARMRPIPGHIDQLIELSEQWKRETAPEVKGFIGEYVYQLDENPDEYLMVVIFSDKETYFANANDPQQDRWYRQIREHLQSDPGWQDGEIVYSSMEAQV